MSSGDLTRMLQEPDGSISHTHTTPSPYTSLSAPGSLSLSSDLLLTLQDTAETFQPLLGPPGGLCSVIHSAMSTPSLFLLTHPPTLPGPLALLPQLLRFWAHLAFLSHPLPSPGVYRGLVSLVVHIRSLDIQLVPAEAPWTPLLCLSHCLAVFPSLPSPLICPSPPTIAVAVKAR